MRPSSGRGSPLRQAERAQWQAGALLSVVIALGGAAALWLDGTRWDAVVVYADPVLVLVACGLISPVPFRLLRSAGLELLEAAPPPAVRQEVAAAVERAQTDFGLLEPFVAATKLGGRPYLEVVFVITGAWQVSEEDAILHAIIDRLEPLGNDIWANVELTTDIDLVE